MYSSLIVEDNAAFVDQLRAYLAQTTLFEPPLVCTTTMEAFSLLNNTSFTLVLLAYNLPGLTGIEPLKGRIILPPVIMIITHAEPAKTCYDLDSVADFMVKPLDYLHFSRGIQRAVEPTLDLNEKKHMFLKSSRELNQSVHNDISYAKAYGIFIGVYTQNGPVVLNQRLKTQENELPGDRFMYPHKSVTRNVQQFGHLEANQVQVSTKKFLIGTTYRPSVPQFVQQAGVLATSN